MIHYKNLSRKSNVYAYEIHADSIDVQFYDSTKVYRYSYRKAGEYHVENMKRLASSGSGLNSYINRYVRFLYD